MANQRRTGRGNQDDSVLFRVLRFGIIPAVVIVLIVVIIQLDKGGDTEGRGTGESDSYLDVEYADKGKLETTEGTGEVEDSGGNRQDDGGDGEGTAQSGEMQTEGDSGSGTMAAEADPAQFPLQQDAMLELTGLVQSYCEAKEECDPELLAWVFGIEDWSEEDKEGERARMELVKASVKGYENISCYSIQGPEQDSYVIFPYSETR